MKVQGELLAFLSDHTCAVAHPQPWERQGLSAKLSVPNLSPTFFPKPSTCTHPQALTTHSWGRVLQAGMLVPTARHEV